VLHTVNKQAAIVWRNRNYDTITNFNSSLIEPSHQPFQINVPQN